MACTENTLSVWYQDGHSQSLNESSFRSGPAACPGGTSHNAGRIRMDGKRLSQSNSQAGYYASICGQWIASWNLLWTAFFASFSWTGKKTSSYSVSSAHSLRTLCMDSIFPGISLQGFCIYSASGVAFCLAQKNWRGTPPGQHWNSTTFLGSPGVLFIVRIFILWSRFGNIDIL